MPRRALGVTLCALLLLLSVSSNLLQARYVYFLPMTGGDIGAQWIRATGSESQQVVARDIQPAKD